MQRILSVVFGIGLLLSAGTAAASTGCDAINGLPDLSVNGARVSQTLGPFSLDVSADPDVVGDFYGVRISGTINANDDLQFLLVRFNGITAGTGTVVIPVVSAEAGDPFGNPVTIQIEANADNLIFDFFCEPTAGGVNAGGGDAAAAALASGRNRTALAAINSVRLSTSAASLPGVRRPRLPKPVAIRPAPLRPPFSIFKDNVVEDVRDGKFPTQLIFEIPRLGDRLAAGKSFGNPQARSSLKADLIQIREEVRILLASISVRAIAEGLDKGTINKDDFIKSTPGARADLEFDKNQKLIGEILSTPFGKFKIDLNGQITPPLINARTPVDARFAELSNTKDFTLLYDVISKLDSPLSVDFFGQMRRGIAANELIRDLERAESRAQQKIEDLFNINKPPPDQDPEQSKTDGVSPNEDLFLNEGESILFQPDSGGFTINLSTDALVDWARQNKLGLGPGGMMTDLRAGSIPLNIWARGRIVELDGDATGIDGLTSDIQLGAAFGVTSDLTLGFFGSLMNGSVDSSRMALDLDTTAYGGGIYGSLRIFEVLDLGMSAAYSLGDADVTIAGADGSYDYDRLGLSISLSGAQAVGNFVLTPAVSLDYLRDSRDDYVDSTGLAVPGGTEEDFAISTGLNISRLWLFEAGPVRSVAPWANATLTYTYRDEKELIISATEQEQADAFSANFGIGANFDFENGLRLGAATGVLSLGQDTIGIFGQIRLSMPLN